MEVQSVFGFEIWWKQRQRASRLSGSLCLLTACGLAIVCFGTAAGIFAFLIALMTIASLIILLVPLGILNKTTFSVATILSVMMEFLITNAAKS